MKGDWPGVLICSQVMMERDTVCLESVLLTQAAPVGDYGSKGMRVLIGANVIR